MSEKHDCCCSSQQEKEKKANNCECKHRKYKGKLLKIKIASILNILAIFIFKIILYK